MNTIPDANDDVDVVVVGSGAAGLMAALVASDSGLSVAVFEKAPLIGGTSAWSGGMPWMPLNAHQDQTGIADSRDEVLAYIRSLADGREPDARLTEAFVDGAAEALAFLEVATPLRMETLTSYPDYYADRFGGKLRGRSVEPAPFASREFLGAWHERVRESPLMPRLTREEMTSALPDRDRLIADRERDGVRTLGSALISGLLHGVLTRNATVVTNARVLELLLEKDRVRGVEVEVKGRRVSVRARRGVVLASGGFEWNRELVRAFLGVAELLPLSPAGNDGDGLLMGMRLGASLGNMTNAVTRPCTYDGVTQIDGNPLPFMAIPRHDPGCIAVDASGYRFANEGISYMDMGRALRAFRPGRGTPDSGPVWLIFDETVRARTSIGDFAPGEPVPAWVHTAPTIEELAVAIGSDPVILGTEVERYNGFAAAGVDRDFGRGTAWFEGLSTGGPSPEKNLHPVDNAPFYAMRMYPGTFGTTGGLLTDGVGRVRRGADAVIPGLYAVGNVAVNPLGSSYPGGGSSLGPNLTFGYLAGRDLAS